MSILASSFYRGQLGITSALRHYLPAAFDLLGGVIGALKNASFSSSYVE